MFRGHVATGRIGKLTASVHSSSHCLSVLESFLHPDWRVSADKHLLDIAPALLRFRFERAELEVRHLEIFRRKRSEFGKSNTLHLREWRMVELYGDTLVLMLFRALDHRAAQADEFSADRKSVV